jgi:hypothetical protein
LRTIQGIPGIGGIACLDPGKIFGRGWQDVDDMGLGAAPGYCYTFFGTGCGALLR